LKGGEERTEPREKDEGQQRKPTQGEGLRVAKKELSQGRRPKGSEERAEPREKDEG